MKKIFRAAALLAVLPFAVSAWASPDVSGAAAAAETPPPAILAQVEIRGIAPLLDAAERIGAPFLPPGQLNQMVSGMGAQTLGCDPLDLFGTSDAPLRALVWTSPAGDPGVIFDFPAANGDVSAFLDRIAAVWPAEDIPAATASKLPPKARIFRLPALSGDNRVLFLPHGERVVALPLAKRGGLSPARATRLLVATPHLSVGGQIAVSMDFEALFSALSAALPPEALADMRSLAAMPATSQEWGIGLDAANILRFDFSLAMRPDFIYLRSGVPSPIVNSILFPDALFAFSGHMDPGSASARDYADQVRRIFGSARPASGETPETQAFLDKYSDFCAKFLPTELECFSGDCAFALLPATDTVPCPWASLSTPADAAAALDSLADRFNAVATECVDLLAEAANLDTEGKLPGDLDVCGALEGVNPRLEAAGERTVGGIPVRTYAFRLTDPDQKTDITVCTFDAAAVGSSLLLAKLPEPALAGVLADLSAGTTDRAPIAAMPAYAALLGTPAPDAATTAIQLVPAAQTVLRALRGRVGELIRETRAAKAAAGEDSDADDDDENPFDNPQLAAFLDATNLPALPVAITQRLPVDSNRIEATLSIPLDDIHALVPVLAPIFSGFNSPSADEADPDEIVDDDGETDTPDEW